MWIRWWILNIQCWLNLFPQSEHSNGFSCKSTFGPPVGFSVSLCFFVEASRKQRENNLLKNVKQFGWSTFLRNFKLTFMDSHVSLEETGTPKPLEAYRAVVWPHSCVNFQMLLQVSWGIKALTAHKAQECPLSCVSFNMHNQSRSLTEAFVTCGTVEGPFTCVNPLVL